MTVSVEDGGRLNAFAKEPTMYVDETYVERYGFETHAERAEKYNGRAAQIGILFGFLSYAITGNLYFGLL
jgi:hypothetical protein